MFEHILFDILFIFIMVSDFMFLQGIYMWLSCTAYILIVPPSFFFFACFLREKEDIKWMGSFKASKGR